MERITHPTSYRKSGSAGSEFLRPGRAATRLGNNGQPQLSQPVTSLPGQTGKSAAKHGGETPKQELHFVTIQQMFLKPYPYYHIFNAVVCQVLVE